MNKNILCAAALAVGCFFNVSDTTAQTVSFGSRLGLNIATVSYAEGDENYVKSLEEDKTSLNGALVGLALNIGVNNTFSIQPEILFSQKGYMFEDGNDHLSEKLNYLELPVLAKFSFGDDEVKFFVNAGPYVAYLRSGEKKSKINGREENLEIAFDYPNYPSNNPNRVKPNRVDLGLAAGGGVALQAGPGTINLEARYDLGLTNINEYEKERPSQIPKVTNRSLGVSVSYLFTLSN